MNELQRFLSEGGWETKAIFIAAVFLILISLDVLKRLFVDLATVNESVMQQIREFIVGKNYTSAIQVCNTLPKSPALTVIREAVLAVENGREAMRASLGGAMLVIVEKCEKRLGYIALIASIATLLGLLGTVAGLTETFSSIGQMDAASKAKVLSEGIARAMLATIAGLVVGIAAMIIHAVCASKSESLINSAQNAGFRAITWIEQAERMGMEGGKKGG